jgi:hypothetical protein
VSEVPFVDVINTMLDETLPLTAGEFIEWGNPKLPEQYAWMRAYSPYDNLQAGAYPAMLLRSRPERHPGRLLGAGEVRRQLRTLKTDPNPLLFKINLEVGHGGASGRFDSLREIAEDDVFCWSSSASWTERRRRRQRFGRRRQRRRDRFLLGSVRALEHQGRERVGGVSRLEMRQRLHTRALFVLHPPPLVQSRIARVGIAEQSRRARVAAFGDRQQRDVVEQPSR